MEGATSYKPYIITVKDAVTGRGIPLVELKTTNEILLYTDAAGRVAFYEPGLMNQEVFFHVHHSDYLKPADFFGCQGRALTTNENGSGEILVDKIEAGRSGCWPLDDGSGTTASEWMHGFNGTLVNGVTWLLGGGVQGGADHALFFDGTNDYMRIPRTIEADFSIAFYLKTTQTAPSGTQWYHGNGIIDANAAGSANDFGVSLNGNKICFGIGNPDTSIFSTSAVNDGNWHFVVATRNASTGKIALYVDTFKEAWASANGNLLNAPAEINVDRQLTGVKYFATYPTSVEEMS
ncbi:MAG: hypothetical protein ISS71_05890 [Phycisphaerae bacterium]|nr:hypothetical protein [Phycisphaerae bacterium]